MPLAFAKPPDARSDIVQSLSGVVTPRVPFWLMRQAGRYLPEYRAVREKAGGFLELCFNPALAAEVTLQPVRRFDTDAAILFSDILTIPHALGAKVEFLEGEGPRVDADLSRLSFRPEKLSAVYETVREVRSALPRDKALIGFAGAPWTVACYMIEGKGSRDFASVKKFALENESAFAALIDTLVDSTIMHLSTQIEAGADAVQLFDTWAGLLPESMFPRWAVDPARKITAALRKKHPDVPVIGFPRGAGALYPYYAAKTGVDGLGIDAQTPLAWALRECGGEVCLQGNLDPVLLLAGGRAMEEEVLRLLSLVRGSPFIFNLGHGVIKETPPENVAHLARLLRGFRR